MSALDLMTGWRGIYEIEGCGEKTGLTVGECLTNARINMSESINEIRQWQGVDRDQKGEDPAIVIAEILNGLTEGGKLSSE